MTLPSFLGPLFFFIVGLSLVAHGIDLIRRGDRSRTWPVVQGRILKSQVERSVGDELGYDYFVTATYFYIVHSREYHCKERVEPQRRTGTGTNQREAEQLLQHYPVGRTLAVSYNPRNPANATVLPGAQRGGWVYIAIGLVMVLVTAPQLLG